jgi:hypothetical protein
MAVSLPNHVFLLAQSSAFGSGVGSSVLLLFKVISGFTSLALVELNSS